MILLIIFGTRGVTYTESSGDFHCPSCERKARYEHKRVRRFFTLYFIPLIPLDIIGEYIECGSCRGTFKQAVLSYTPGPSVAAFEAEFQAAIKRTMVLMLLADGVVEEAEITAVCGIYSKVAKRDVSRGEVEQEIARAKTDGKGVNEFLKSVRGNLNDAGKSLVVKSAYMVAAADGTIHEQETKLLAQIAQSLEMTPAAFKGIVTEMTRGA